MANNHSSEVSPDDFLEQLFGMTTGVQSPSSAPTMLQLNGGGDGGYGGLSFPLGLSLDQGRANAFTKPDEASGAASIVKNVFHGQPMSTTGAGIQLPPIQRPRVRARRGKATDPHSIAERKRREKIAERIRALQELVPGLNKTDRAAMLDEIMDYVKFLILQEKVLRMNGLGGAGAVAPLTNIPLASIADEGSEGGRNQPDWERWSTDGTERQVAKLMEENVGAAMQFLQTKALCIMPIHLASAIYHTQPQDTTTYVKPESNPPS